MIALLPWGAVIEDFLDSIGISLEEFCQEFTGSWMFGYVEALKTAGLDTIIICISSRVTAPIHSIHAPTGARVCILPAPLAYRLLQRIILTPNARTIRHMFGETLASKPLLRPFLAVLRELALYLATPPIRVGRVLRQAKCRAVLCQEYEYPRFDVCFVVGRLLGMPVFASFQGGNYQRSRIERWSRPLAMRGCSGLIIGAAAEIGRVRSRYNLPPSKLAHIGNPIDTEFWRPVDQDCARRALGIPQQARVVAWHGRISVWKKGLDILIEAWLRLITEHPDIDLRLILVGAGEDASWMRERIEVLGLRGIHWYATFTQDRTMIRNYLSAADVYAFPSRHEGFAMALIEAMACGLPVAAADASGVADVLAKGELSGGLIVPRENATALVDAIWRLLGDPTYCRELGRRARSRAGDFAMQSVGRSLRAFLLGEKPNDFDRAVSGPDRGMKANPGEGLGSA